MEQIDPLYENDNVVSEDQKQQIEDAYSAVQEKYGIGVLSFDESGEIIITEADETRLSLALDEFLELSGFNDAFLMQRSLHLGKHTWNSTGFISKAIDLAITLVGLVSGFSSIAAARAALKASRKTLTRVAESVILKALGNRVKLVVGSIINAALTLVSKSIGGLIAEALDRVDGTNNGYIFS